MLSDEPSFRPVLTGLEEAAEGSALLILSVTEARTPVAVDLGSLGFDAVVAGRGAESADLDTAVSMTVASSRSGMGSFVSVPLRGR